MHYPLWDMPLVGGGMTIGIISIVHVVIAHFAVGAGLFNVVSEMKARRQSDASLLRFVRSNSLFLLYLAFVSGAVTGVGIWFSIGVVAPEATTYLIRLFFWIWAIEWVFFVVELTAGYVYYATWDRVSPAVHVLVGWLYAVAAFLSLVMINGILTFMLTPGEWLTTGNLWDAWLNPSFWPSLAMRTVSSLALAGIFVAVVASTRRGTFDQSDKGRIVAWGARFLLPLALMPILAIWYFSTIPESARSLALGGAVAMTFLFIFGALLSFLVALYAYFGMLRRARDVNIETALLLAAIAFLATGSAEFVREGIRKPYVLHGILYSNGIFAADAARLDREGILRNTPWIVPDTVRFKGDVAVGEAVYRAQCLRCHEVDGYNAIRPLVRHWNRGLILSALDHLDQIRAFMPPFIGTEDEKQALTTYLQTLTGVGWSAETLPMPQPVAGRPESVAADTTEGGIAP